MDEDGKAILTNLPRRLPLHHFSFKGPLSALAFSPSGHHFGAALGRAVEIWQTPELQVTGAEDGLAFAPFIRHRHFTGHHDQVLHLMWSNDDRFLLSSSKDLTARIWSKDPEDGFSPTILAGHREDVLGAWFSRDQENVGFQRPQ